MRVAAASARFGYIFRRSASAARTWAPRSSAAHRRPRPGAELLYFGDLIGAERLTGSAS